MKMRTTLGDTWIDDEELAYNTYHGSASGSNRRGLVRFSDGKLRMVRLGVPDTYFTIPAKPSKGKIGYVSVQSKANCVAEEMEFQFFGGA